MDEKHLAVVCNLEFLGPEYESGYVHCGMNLAVAIAKGDAEAEDYPLLKPWEWDNISALNIWAVDVQDGMPKCSSVGQQISAQPYAFPDLTQDLRNAVDQQFDQIKASSDNLVWQVKPLDPEVAHVSDVKDARPWHGFLAQSSQFPYPIAQSLRLSMVFKLKRATLGNFKYFVAAPEFTVGGKKYVPDTNSSGLQACDSGSASFCCWKYVTDNGTLGAYAYVSPTPLAVSKSASTYIDLKTQLVLWPQTTTNSFSEDWRRRLADRAADGLDLSQRIIDWLRLLVSTNQQSLISAEDLVELRNGFLGALRDSIDLGLRVGPNQESCMTYLVGRWTDDEKKRIELLEKLNQLTWDLTLDDWRQFLRGQAAELASSLSLSTVPYLDSRSVDLVKEIGELQRLRNYLQENDNLLRLALGQASDRFQKQFPDDFTKFSDFFHQSTLSDSLLSRKLALARLGSSTGSKDEITMWRSLISTDVAAAKQADQLAELRTRFSDLLKSYAYGRLSGQAAPNISSQRMPSPDYFKQFLPAVSAVSSDLLGRFAKYLGDWANSFGPTLVPFQIEGTAEKKKSAVIATTPVPHPLTFQVDQVFLRTEKDSTDVEDILRKISGIGILIREEGSEWRFLNMASVIFSTKATEQPWRGPFLVPSGLHYTQDQRQSFISYNNQPLIGKSPLAWLAGFSLQVPVREKSAKAQASTAINTPPPFYYTYFKHDPNAPTVWDKIIGLTFGKNYEVVAFAISNCGALPKELAEGGNPCKLANAIPKLDSCNCTIKVPYRRRVKIGPIRYCDVDAERSAPRLNSREVKLPEIPNDVYLRVRELVDASKQKAGASKGAHNQKTQALDAADSPVLLLVSEADKAKLRKADIRSSFKFHLRPPATDVETWDRWAGRAMTQDDRTKIWQSYFTILKSNQTAAAGSAKDVSIDDPAITGYYFRLVRVKDGSVVGEGAAPIPKNAVVTELGLVQSPPISVDIAVVPTSAGAEKLVVDVQAGSVTVRVIEGEVYKLLAYAVLIKTDYGTRFDPIYEDLLPSAVGQNTYWMSPFSLYLEVATANRISSEELWNSLSLSMTKSRVCHADVVVSSDQARTVHAVELRRQMWRWQGRPLPADVPTSEQCSKPFDPAVLKFETAEFGNRDDNDALWHSTDPQIAADGSKSFRYQEDLSNDPRASYFRFSARALHRYQGIYSANLAVISLHSDEPKLKTPWKRLLVKYRFAKQLPIPQVKVALPLTEASTDGGGNSDMLVVLNDAWFQHAGLAEQLYVEVDHARLPEVPLNQADSDKTNLYQISPDPILTGASAPNWTALGDVGIVGPVGHTFDRSSGAQLFGSSSFIVSVPSPPNNDGAKRDQSWWFAKLRFQRRFDAKLADTVEGASPSEFTLGHWVQYLPAFSLFDRAGSTTGKVNPANYVIVPSDDTIQTLTLYDAREKATVTLKPSASEPATKFSLFLVLTQGIVDSGGRPNQESYIGLYKQAVDKWIRLSGGTQLPLDLTHLKARIIEVQVGDNPTKLSGVTSEEEFWKRLFEPEFKPQPIRPGGAVEKDTVDTEQSRARIVRISKPIESWSLSSTHAVL